MVVRAEHVKPGKGPAYQQVELKDLVDGTKLNERFRAAETVERVRLEEKEYQFLYEEGGQLNLMDQETFEQIDDRRGAARRQPAVPAGGHDADGAGATRAGR